MKTVRARLKSISPYSQSKHYELDKLEKESHEAYEKRTWNNRLHFDKDGQVYIPPMAFKNCLSECAKYLSITIKGKGKATYTKHFEAGVLVMDKVYLGLNKDDVPGECFFVPSNGQRGGGTRVNKWFPVISDWESTVIFYVLDETITEDIFTSHLIEAGKFIGIGRFRPRNNGFYGRFEVVNIDWDCA